LASALAPRAVLVSAVVFIASAFKPTAGLPLFMLLSSGLEPTVLLASAPAPTPTLNCPLVLSPSAFVPPAGFFFPRVCRVQRVISQCCGTTVTTAWALCFERRRKRKPSKRADHETYRSYFSESEDECVHTVLSFVFPAGCFC